MPLFDSFTIGNALMILFSVAMIMLAVFKEFEPAFLIPMGFGAILANLPVPEITSNERIFSTLYNFGIRSHLFPLLILIGIGAMMDFRSLLSNPKMVPLGVAGQLGILCVFVIAALFRFTPMESASIVMSGALDGPLAVFISAELSPRLLAPIVIAAYLCKGMLPIIQPALMKLMTTKKERGITVEISQNIIPPQSLVIFPIVITLVFGLLIPQASLLIGMLMLGNLLRESGVVDRLSKAAQNELVNITTLLFALTIGISMNAQSILHLSTLLILILGFFSYMLNITIGLLIGKILARISHNKINPLLCVAGTGPFPISGQLVAQLAQDEDYDNFILPHALGINTASRLMCMILGGILISLVGGM